MIDLLHDELDCGVNRFKRRWWGEGGVQIYKTVSINHNLSRGTDTRAEVLGID